MENKSSSTLTSIFMLEKPVPVITSLLSSSSCAPQDLNGLL